jgi:hypothetical protein
MRLQKFIIVVSLLTSRLLCNLPLICLPHCNTRQHLTTDIGNLLGKTCNGNMATTQLGNTGQHWTTPDKIWQYLTVGL